MPKLRTVVWLCYVPLTLGLTWLVMRLMIAFAMLVTIGRIDTLAMASGLAYKSLPYVSVTALAMYAASMVFLRLKKRTAFVICAEIASISAAKLLGFLAVVVHVHGDALGSWAAIIALGLAWLAVERRGAWPWRRALRMFLLVVGVFLVVLSAAHI